ncbi:neuroligin-4, X-linked-like [Physella acuta]|uniref:neuroligin-4, X-linked-like n=1 Tax=Physella acuta TaxID=109671 RepID=UPI0027DDA602|nr:neuroligin-4, X-linked-like [Physella acuta]
MTLTLRSCVALILHVLVWMSTRICADDRYVIVSTSYGQVRGVTVDDGTEPKVNKFMGIPFAKSTAGSRRFKPPEPPEKWNVTLDALTQGHECYQPMFPFFDGIMKLSEDCLNLNVYVPQGGGLQLPVMVWIHGGGYISGAGWTYNAPSLARKGVVVVTINYRLGVFGFLSTEDDVIPGNFGLLDQIMALKWVKANIASFGGDPNRVTIFGESAGSSSVSILTLSPLARGLFTKAIMQSGSSLTPWAITLSTSSLPPKKIASLIGAKVNCSSGNSSELLSCLQDVGALELHDASMEVQEETGIKMLLTPCVETTFGVLPHHPHKLLKSGQFNYVDTIHGFNSDEGGEGNKNGTSRAEFRQYFRNFFDAYKIEEVDSLLDAVEQAYLYNTTDRQDINKKLSAARTDFYHAAATYLEITSHSESASERKHYLYEFSYRKSISDLPSWVRAIHADDIPFLFHDFVYPFWQSSQPPSRDDLLVSEQLQTLWTNFAKTADPTTSLPVGGVTWQPFSDWSKKRLKIDSQSVMEGYDGPAGLYVYMKFLELVEKTLNTDVIVG